jgi:hypothetical protein
MHRDLMVVVTRRRADCGDTYSYLHRNRAAGRFESIADAPNQEKP